MSRAAPLSALVELCHSLRHYLGAGLSLLDVFRHQANRGPSALRDASGGIAKDLGKGASLEEALNRQRDVFPTLFIELAVAGEQSGSMPDVFTELETYYRLVQRLRRQLWSQLTWPITQFILGVLVVTLMIFILGVVNPAFDPLGFGLTGTKGALIFLAIVFGLALSLFFTGRFLFRRAGMGAWLLKRPILGPCLMSMALHRFSVALRLTTGTGMPIGQAVRLSLRATGSEGFSAAADTVVASLEKGNDLTRSLGRAKLFPDDYLDMLSGAEISGRLDDVLDHQARYYAEEAERKLTALTKAFGAVIWVLIGGFLVFLIFRLASTYINMLNNVGI
jgi:type II secretory pathway component PulF